MIATSFQGSTAAYRAALRKAHATVGEARDVLGDEIVRLRVEQKLRVAAPTQGQVSAFYSNYAQVDARAMRSQPAAPWLNGSRGIAIEGFAPDRIFKFPRHQWNVVRLPFASYHVEATGPTVPLRRT